MKYLTALVLMFLLASPATAHRRYLVYTTVDTTDNTTPSSYTDIAGLAMGILQTQKLSASCTIVTSSAAASTGVVIGLKGPTTGGTTVTGYTETIWPDVLGKMSNITSIRRSGEDDGINGVCPDGYTCIGAPNNPYTNGDTIRIVSAGDMGQLVGLTAQVENRLLNFIDLPIDSSVFTPWGGTGAEIERVTPPKKYITAFNFTPGITDFNTSLGTTKTITNMRFLVIGGSVAGTVQPTITSSNANATVTAHIGSWCEYTYQP